MVKFGEILESQMVVSFKPNYVSYSRLKRHIEKCAYLRDQWLKLQKKNFGGDSDEEQVAEVILSNTKDTIKRIKKRHISNNHMTSVESRERLDALTLDAAMAAPDSPDLEKGRKHIRPPSNSKPSASSGHIDNELPLVLPPPAITNLSSANRSLSSERRAKAYNFQNLVESDAMSNSGSSRTNSNNSLKSIEVKNDQNPLPTETTSLLAGVSSGPPPLPPSSMATFPISIPRPPPSPVSKSKQRSQKKIVPTSSIHPRNSDPTERSKVAKNKKKKKSLSPPRKGNRSGGEGSPLLRHIAAKAYDSYATSEELGAYSSLEVEVEKFWDMIETDLNKVDSFFEGKVAEYHMTLESFYVHESMMGRGSPERKGSSSTNLNGMNRVRKLTLAGSAAPDLRSVKKLYIELMQLQNFVKLNGTGFRKIVKKFDKTVHRNFLPKFMESLKHRQFMRSSATLEMIEKTTRLVSRDKLMDFKSDAQAVIMNPGRNKKLVEGRGKIVDALDAFFSSEKVYRPWAMALTVFLTSVAINAAPFHNDDIANRALAFLTLVVSLWITKAVPFHATAMLIPPAAVLFRVLRDGQGSKVPMDTKAASNAILHSFFNHNTFLILGGYTVSACFSRCDVERRIAAMMQARFENSPKLFLLAMMLLGLFLSMWISNHTAPVLCISVISPIISDFGSDSRFVKALLLGVAFACNFGGMMTPISSLQNIIAIEQMNNAGYPMSFGEWIILSTPIALVGTLLAWLLIIVVMKPNDVQQIPKIVYEDKPFGFKAYFVCIMSGLTILAWANSGTSKLIFGDLGVISLLFMTIMFGSGVLTEIDLNSFAWHTLFLLGGSNVLGTVVESSQLLEHIVKVMKHALPDNKVMVACEVFFAACLMATFVSHSVAAIVLVPVVAHIGKTFHAVQEFSFGGALAISAAMAFPFSSFPNVYSLLVVDDFGNPYLTTGMFLKIGTPASIFCVLLLVFGLLGKEGDMETGQE